MLIIKKNMEIDDECYTYNNIIITIERIFLLTMRNNEYSRYTTVRARAEKTIDKATAVYALLAVNCSDSLKRTKENLLICSKHALCYIVSRCSSALDWTLHFLCAPCRRVRRLVMIFLLSVVEWPTVSVSNTIAVLRDHQYNITYTRVRQFIVVFVDNNRKLLFRTTAS